MSNKKNKIISLIGPTGIGKSSLAIKLQAKHPIEIISVDSAMIYRDMNIGTDKPSDQILSSIKHHLVNIRNPNESYNVGQFYSDVRTVISNIHKDNKTPLLVGGSMMYFNSLLNGLSPLPEKSFLERRFIDDLLLKYSSKQLHFCLKDIDPLSYINIDEHDTQRIQRALEVYICTGKPITSFFDNKIKLSDEYDLLTLKIISKDRSLIHDKISIRTKSMFNNNFIDEVAHTVKKYSLTADNQSMRSIGYRQVLSYLQGNIMQKDLENRCIYATRQLAKRQITWLKQFNDSTTIDIAENFYKNIDEAIDNHLHFQ